jgi:hypothetical protein
MRSAGGFPMETIPQWAAPPVQQANDRLDVQLLFQPIDLHDFFSAQKMTNLSQPLFHAAWRTCRTQFFTKLSTDFVSNLLLKRRDE